MINTYFSPRQIVDVNRNTEHLFNRYGISSSSNKSIFENSFSKNYNGFFLVDLLSCFNDVEQLESIQFEIYEIPVLVDYLKRSHRYYISKRFPEIEQTVENIKNQEPTLLVSFLDRFVHQYKEDLINHFEIEEKILFPYALKLYNYYHFEDKRNKQYLIDNMSLVRDFLDDHKKDKSELKKLEESISKYKTRNLRHLSYFEILLERLKNFHIDLKIHSQIEDHVLDKKINSILENSNLQYENSYKS
tara:strand:+ start:534 stop:1271 length:738 start_codon:yes stop_codon:yes gene_type:complete